MRLRSLTIPLYEDVFSDLLATPLKMKWDNDPMFGITCDFGWGNLEFFVAFSHLQKDGYWNRSWSPSNSTYDFIRSNQTGRSTGLFPSINNALKRITIEFITKYKPTALVILGADAKRNKFNSENYGSWHVPGYRFELITSDESSETHRAYNGITGVRFVRENQSISKKSNTLVEYIIPSTSYGYWITGDGKFMPVPWYSHETVASNHLEKTEGPATLTRYPSAVSEVMDRGWIAVRGLDTNQCNLMISDHSSREALKAAIKLIATIRDEVDFYVVDHYHGGSRRSYSTRNYQEMIAYLRRLF